MRLSRTCPPHPETPSPARKASMFNGVAVGIVVLCCVLYQAVSGEPVGVYVGPASRLRDFLFLGQDVELGFRPPLYPLLLASISALLSIEPGDLLRLFAFLNVVMLASAFYLYLRLIDLRLDARCKVPFVLLCLVTLAQIQETGIIRETTLYTLLAAGFVFVMASREISQKTSLIGGGLTGLLILTRPSGYLFVIVFLVCLLLPGSGLALRTRAKYALWYLFAIGALLLPWQIILSSNADQTVLLVSCTSGMNSYKSNSHAFGDFYLYHDVDRGDLPADDPEVHLCTEDRRMREIASADLRQDIFERPVDFALDRAIRATGFIMGHLPYGSGEVVWRDGSNRVVGFEFSKTKLLYGFLGAFVFALAVLGAVLLAATPQRDNLRLVLILSLMFLGHLVLHTFTWPETRFKLPVDFALNLLAAQCLWWVCQAWRGNASPL